MSNAKKTKAQIIEELKISKYQAKHWKQKSEKEFRKRIKEEDMIEDLRGMLSVAKPLKALPRAKLKTKHKQQEAVLLFSDAQIGERTQKKETGYVDYNVDIFKKEVERLYTSILNILERHRKDCPIEKLNILMLGDVIEGTGNIFRGQGSRIETDVVEQVLTYGIPIITNFIRSMARYFKEIYVPCIVGNHGRIRNKGEDLAYVNWDYVCYQFIKQVLSDIPNVKIEADKCWWKIVDIQKWKFYLEHGDAVQRYMRMPWYGMQRSDGETLMMMQSMKKTYHYYIMGHHHEPFEWDRPVGERICNGTFARGNAFAMRYLKSTVRPTQKFFFVHPEIGITARYNIRLDMKKEYID